MTMPAEHTRRIVTRHLTRRRAKAREWQLIKMQTRARAGDPEAIAELQPYRITAASVLSVHHQLRRVFKWAVEAVG